MILSIFFCIFNPVYHHHCGISSRIKPDRRMMEHATLCQPLNIISHNYGALLGSVHNISVQDMHANQYNSYCSVMFMDSII